MTTAAGPGTRYAGKPLLRLMELYVLWSIGELDQDQERVLVQMTPKLQALYGVPGEWHDVLGSVIGASPELPSALNTMWLNNKRISVESGVNLEPQTFAERVVDENFAGG